MAANSVAGGTLHTSTACFTQDGAHVLVASGKSIRVYSAATGDRLLILNGHSATVNAVCRHKKDDSQVLSASSDGTINAWEWAEARVKHTWTLGYPIVAMVLPDKHSALLSLEWRNGEAGRVGSVNLDYATSKLKLGNALKCSKPIEVLAVAANGVVAAALERNTLHIISPAKIAPKPVTLHHSRHLSCVAFDSTSTRVAAGDVSGRIIIWSGIPTAGQADFVSDRTDSNWAPQLAVTTVHWHAHRVGAVTFSHDGTYLLSGGQEAVLVLWQLETMKKSFLPRLGGHITRIERDPHDAARYAVCQGDSAVRLVALSTMQVEASIYGVRPRPHSVRPSQADVGVAMQPGSGYVVLPCFGSQVQFYDAAKDRHVARLSVVPRNTVSATEAPGHGQAEEPFVSRVAFTHDAATLVSVETYVTAASKRGYALKFWDNALLRQSPCTYAVNTTIMDPHMGRITALVCHPRIAEVVTCGVRRRNGDGEFRVWAKSKLNAVPGSNTAPWLWVCRSVGSYQDRPISCAAYAPDGSVLAVGSPGMITLWDLESNAMLASLVPPPDGRREPSTQLAFLSGGTFLVSAHGGADARLCVWNVLSLTLCWSCPARVADLAPHPAAPLFAAVFAADGPSRSVVALLKPDSSVAMRTWVTQGEAAVTRAMFAPLGSGLHSRAGSAHAAARSCGTAGVPLLLLSSSRQMALLHDDIGDADTPRQSLPLSAPAEAKGGFTAMYGGFGANGAQGGKRDGNRRQWLSKTGQIDLDVLFDAPTHMLPSTSELCDTMLRALLLPA